MAKGWKHTLETRKRMSKGRRGISAWNKGKSPSVASRKRMSEAHKGKVPWNLGRKTGPLSSPYRKKLSRIRKKMWAEGTMLGMTGKTHKTSRATRVLIAKRLAGNTNGVGHTLAKRHCSAISERMCGNTNFLGRKHSEASKAKMAAAQKKSKAKRTEVQKANFLRKWAVSNNLSPNKQELVLNTLIQRYFPKEFKLNVKGGIVIAGKIPDFVNCNGKKVLIELFGDYWHSKKITGNTPTQEEAQRRKVFSEYGFKTAIIWEHELRDKKLVLSKIKLVLED
jgi:G:T-mismatch repair DNA endonuclease (very short patch repair protein)